jgi:hypothetical protein
MKKITLLMSAMLVGGLTYAQQVPVGTPPAGGTGVKANSAWYRGGNFQGGPAGTSNIFGTMWNSPIYTYTNGIPRMKLNGNNTYPIDGYNAERISKKAIASKPKNSVLVLTLI